MTIPRIRTFCLTVSVFILALVVFSCAKERGKHVPEGSAPDFTLSDIHGNTIRLSDLTGKVVMLEFWATWCGPCIDSVPEMNALYEEYRSRGFIVLGISMDKGKDMQTRLGSFAKEHSITYPILHDSGDVNGLYGVNSIPSTFLIDKKGNMVSKHVGFSPSLKEILSKEIEALL
jgi:cytochrome c biogenesis protein CcmG/thiol:disulfide interchange protein DsbE